MNPIGKFRVFDATQAHLMRSEDVGTDEPSSLNFSEILNQQQPEVSEESDVEEDLEKNVENGAISGLWQLLPEVSAEPKPMDCSSGEVDISAETGATVQQEEVELSDETVPAPVEDGSTSTNLFRPVPPTKQKVAENSDGMTVAKQSAKMQLEFEQDKFAEPGRLKLQEVQLSVPSLEISAPHPNFSAVAHGIYSQAPVQIESNHEVIPSQPVEVEGGGEMVVKAMHEQVLLIKELKRSEMQVVLGLNDQHLNLHLKQETPGVITIQAWCDSKGFDCYKDQWAELQKAMDAQGVVLDSLQLQHQSGNDRKQAFIPQWELGDANGNSIRNKISADSSDTEDQTTVNIGHNSSQQWWA